MLPILPTSAEFKLQIDQRRLIINAAAGTPNPEVTKNLLFGLLRAIESELARALDNDTFVGTSIQVTVDPNILAMSTAVRVRNLLVALGYTVQLDSNVATISW
jgi:hypothetical protein